MTSYSQANYKPQISKVLDHKTIFGCRYLLVSYTSQPETFIQWLREEQILETQNLNLLPGVKGLDEFASETMLMKIEEFLQKSRLSGNGDGERSPRQSGEIDIGKVGKHEGSCKE